MKILFTGNFVLFATFVLFHSSDLFILLLFLSKNKVEPIEPIVLSCFQYAPVNQTYHLLFFNFQYALMTYSLLFLSFKYALINYYL